MPSLTPRLFARERIGRLGKAAQVEEVYLAPFRGKDYRHKAVCHLGAAGVLRFWLQSLGDAGKEALLSRRKADAASRERLSPRPGDTVRHLSLLALAAPTRC